MNWYNFYGKLMKWESQQKIEIKVVKYSKKMPLANTVSKHSIVDIHSYSWTLKVPMTTMHERNFPSTIYSYYFLFKIIQYSIGRVFQHDIIFYLDNILILSLPKFFSWHLPGTLLKSWKNCYCQPPLPFKDCTTSKQ